MYKVLKKFSYKGADGKKTIFSKGDEIKAEEFFSPDLIADLLEDKHLEIVSEQADQSAPEERAAAVPVKKFEGKVIIAEGTRTVNEKEYRWVRLEDGSIQDVTDEDYKLKVVVEE